MSRRGSVAGVSSHPIADAPIKVLFFMSHLRKSQAWHSQAAPEHDLWDFCWLSVWARNGRTHTAHCIGLVIHSMPEAIFAPGSSGPGEPGRT